MLGIAGEEIQGVGQEGKDGAEGAFGSAGAAGEVENEGVAGDAADAAAEGGVGGVVHAILTDKLGEAGDEAVADGEGGLGGYVARGEAGATRGEDQGGAAGCCAQGGGEEFDLIGDQEGVQHLGAGLGEQMGDGWAGEIDLRAGDAAVADGDDDGSAASERCGSLHVSRIDAGARNMAEDEKIEGPASSWSGDLLRQAQPSPWLIRHRLTADADNTPTDRSRTTTPRE